MTKNLLNNGKTAAFSLRAAASGITEPVKEQEEKQVTGQSPASPAREPKDYTRFAFVCDSNLARKVRAVSAKEGVSIRQIMEKAMKDWLTRYEAKNGPVGNFKAKTVEDL